MQTVVCASGIIVCEKVRRQAKSYFRAFMVAERLKLVSLVNTCVYMFDKLKLLAPAS